MKKSSSVIYLVIFFLFANQAWAADWIYFDTAAVGNVYYDKGSIKKVNESIISVRNKGILSKKAKAKYFSILKGIHKAPENPSMLSYYTKLIEIDCVNRKIKDISVTFYNEKDKVVYSSPESESGDWNAILPDTVGEKLIHIVSFALVTPKDAVVVPKVEESIAPKVGEPIIPKDAVVAPKVEEHVLPKVAAVATPAVTDKNQDQVNNKQIEKKAIPKKAVRNFLTKWLNSWKSGDMETYRSCYASDFQSRGMNLDAWVSFKSDVYQKSKNINISIDELQIIAEENNATAVFAQSYSSSTFKSSGKKTLELRKINDEWKIYREIM